jgi:hypothetical protein
MTVGAGVVGSGIAGAGKAPAGTVSKLAGTPAAGYAYTAGINTTIATFTTPNDGKMHHFQLAWTIVAGAAGTTGGAIRLIYTSGGQQNFTSINAGGLTDNDYLEGSFVATIDPNTTVTLQQQTALSAGSATMFATMIGE